MHSPRAHTLVGAALALCFGACTCGGPELESIAPTAVRAGGPGFTLAVTGSEFGQSTKAVFGDKRLATTRVDVRHLTAQVDASDIASPGMVKVHLSEAGATGSADFKIASAAELPRARICSDVLVRAGAAAQLDGSCSVSPTGAPLTYSWTFTEKPSGSSAAFDDPAAVLATFNADAAGDYQVQLVVRAGDLASDPASALASSSRIPPVANAGPDKVVALGATAALDGARSTDVNGGPLTYAWTFASRPEGSQAAFSDAHDVRPRFVADVQGTYEIDLKVSDPYLASSPSRVRISTSPLPPIANAGRPQGVGSGAQVALDGSASISPSGAPLTYRWALIASPPGSRAALSSASAVQPTFTADANGVFVAQLMVNDGTSDSDPATVLVIAGAARPVAVVGPDQKARLGEAVGLDGSLSSAAAGRTLTYRLFPRRGEEGIRPRRGSANVVVGVLGLTTSSRPRASTGGAIPACLDPATKAPKREPDPLG